LTSEATWADKYRASQTIAVDCRARRPHSLRFGKNTSPASRRPDMPFRPKTAGARRREIDRHRRRGFSRCPRTAPCSRETHGRVPASRGTCFGLSSFALAPMKPPAPQQPRPSSRHRRIQVAAAPLTQSGTALARKGCLRPPSPARAPRPARGCASRLPSNDDLGRFGDHTRHCRQWFLSSPRLARAARPDSGSPEARRTFF
jgi:hypothetical protein